MKGQYFASVEELIDYKLESIREDTFAELMKVDSNEGIADVVIEGIRKVFGLLGKMLSYILSLFGIGSSGGGGGGGGGGYSKKIEDGAERLYKRLKKSKLNKNPKLKGLVEKILAMENEESENPLVLLIALMRALVSLSATLQEELKTIPEKVAVTKNESTLFVNHDLATTIKHLVGFIKDYAAVILHKDQKVIVIEKLMELLKETGGKGDVALERVERIFADMKKLPNLSNDNLLATINCRFETVETFVKGFKKHFPYLSVNYEPNDKIKEQPRTTEIVFGRTGFSEADRNLVIFAEDCKNISEVVVEFSLRLKDVADGIDELVAANAGNNNPSSAIFELGNMIKQSIEMLHLINDTNVFSNLMVTVVELASVVVNSLIDQYEEENK